MLGPIANAAAILIFGLIGCFFVKNLPQRFEEIIRKVLALLLIYIGFKGALDGERIILMLLSLTIGATIGELINFDKIINNLGALVEKRFAMGGERPFSKAFASTTILYCTGSIIIVGALQSGLTGNNDILFMKSIIDGIFSLVFAASMGIGVAFSSIPVLICESALVLGARAVKDFLTPDIIREMSAVGSLLVAGIGFNFLGIKEIRIANLVPAVFIPFIIITIEMLIKS